VRWKTEPFKHQKSELEQTALLPGWARFWEMGTGKTKTTIDEATCLLDENLIDGLLVVAPNGVHLNWTLREVTSHFPEDLLARANMMAWRSAKAATKRHAAQFQEVLNSKLPILSISYDAFMTDRGKKAVWSLMQKKRLLYVADESTRIKTPGAKRTMSIVRSAKHAPFRRILTGTPVTNGPFDAYTQMKFVDPTFWHPLGINTAAEFRTMFGVFEKDFVMRGGKLQDFERLVGYRNIPLLYDKLETLSSRVLKEDVLDLPPKLYVKLPVALSANQRRAAQQLCEDYMIEWSDGQITTAELAIVRLLRLQQVLCGYLPVDERCPRFEAALEWLGDTGHQVIIFSRFRRDIEKFMEALGASATRYDGTVDDDDRQANIDRFQAGDAQFFVANQQAAGTGLTLTAAKAVLYYTNNYNLEDRLQSEDRAHRIGQDGAFQPNGEHGVLYCDMVGEDTVDERIIDALVRKKELAEAVLGDTPRSWI
jgi:SNF2 family DNA or RNA helicase